MAISEAYIMKLVREYAKSPEGKQAIREKYGIEYDEKFTRAQVKAYGNRMKKILYNHIHDEIKSISLDDIIVEEPLLREDGRFEIKLSFREGSLHRESLYPDGYPDGLKNIVLLFAKGYHTSHPVHGDWTYNGSVVAKSVWGKRSRAPSNFLNDAVDEFNGASAGVATAYLEGEYV